MMSKLPIKDVSSGSLLRRSAPCMVPASGRFVSSDFTSSKHLLRYQRTADKNQTGSSVVEAFRLLVL